MVRVDPDITVFDISGTGVMISTANTFDAGNEFGQMERFWSIVVGTQIQAGDLVLQ